MIAYRIAHIKYIEDTSGTGSRIYGGRWNPQGIGCVYSSQYLSLALLEKLVHAQQFKDMKQLGLVTFEITNKDLFYEIDKEKLKEGWAEDIIYTQSLGKQIFENSEYLAFTTPSVIIPTEKNIIFRPEAFNHPQIIKKRSVSYEIDKRLLPMVSKQTNLPD
jgi:RES domain-containing protein